MYIDIIMNDSTFISKLPDTGGKNVQNNQTFTDNSSFNDNFNNMKQNNQPKNQNPEINANTYTPINIHSNPYGFKNDIDTQQFPVETESMHRLPSRDIPIDQTKYTHDEVIKPNYIEEPKNMKDYIQDFKEEESERIRKHNIEKNKLSRFDRTVTELKEFVLIMVLYFLSFMPIVTTLMQKYLNILGIFETDGNLNLRGQIFKSASFALVYYITFQVINRTFPTI